MPEMVTGSDSTAREDPQLVAVMAAEIRARRMRDLARERLARARAEQVEIEEALRRADIAIRQGRARLAAIEDADAPPPGMHDAGASRGEARTLASGREVASDLARQLSECETEARGLSAALEARRDANDQVRRQLEAAHAEEADLRQEIESTRHAAITLSGELGDLHTQCGDLQARMKREVDAVVSIEAELDTLLRRRDLAEATRQATADRITATEQQNEADQARLAALSARAQAASDDMARLEAECIAADARLRKAQDDQESARSGLVRLEAERARLEAERGELDRRLQAENATLAQCQARLAEVLQSRAQAEQELATLVQLQEEAATRRQVVAQALAETQASQRDEETARDAIAGTLESTRNEAAALADMLNRETAELARIQRRLHRVRSARERRAGELDAAQAANLPAAPSVSPQMVDADAQGDDSPQASSATPMTAQPPPTRPRWRPRIALAGAFGAAALAIYLVPRLWPGGPPPAAASSPAAENPAPSLAPLPADIYAADPAAQRDLTLAREIRVPPQRRQD